ncbi:unnamed protein product [Ranitomeya imitator]|uniref:G-protein coupled receptors family 1 profile domain-containing protein n=1 Tax=Ranitomeya imitator TaxID=111125 RepID=A0ABN9MTM0_9NEOB|nr:unnamed protein product [Ranitomeya imitator]
MSALQSQGPFEGPQWPHLAPRSTYLIIASLMGLVVVLAFFVNGMVIVVSLKFKKLRSPLNYILVNLAVADLLVTIFGSSISFYNNIFGYFTMGKIMCEFEGFMVSLTGIVGLWSLAILAFERYIVICKPMGDFRFQQKHAIMGCAFTWIWAFTWTSPPLFGWCSYVTEGLGTSCGPNWYTGGTNNNSYIMVLFGTCFAMPLTTIIFSYSNLLFALRAVTLGLLYDEPNSVDHAEKTLLALCQGQEAAELYCQKFRKWSVLTKWNEEALAAIFRKGLSETLKDVMVGFPTLAGLSESMSLAIQIDRRLRERKAVHHMAVSSEQSSEPMQHDRILTRIERQEFRQMDPVKVQAIHDWIQPTSVEVDASEIGAGAVLSQRESDGSLMKPCAFFSRKFSPAERNYDVGNRELLAMKWAFEEWRHWLEGAKHRVVVLTDHKNLIYLESAKRLNTRQTRWSLFFSRFDFVVSYLPGSKNVKADALSRSFSPDSPGVLEPVGILKEGVILSAISPDLRRVLQEFQADRPDRCPVGKLFVPDRWTSKVEPSDCPGVDSVVDRLQQIWTHVVDNLTLSQERAQRFANRRRCVGPRLRVGDLVWLSSHHVPMKVSSPKFKPRFIGPYKISEIINPVSFRLALPASFAIHNVFHRSLLRRYVVPVVPSVDPPAPVLVEGELEYEVEKILDSRFSRRRLQYLVKWKGYGQEDNSWVVASDVHATDLVRAFHLARPDQPGGSVEAYQCELILSCWKLWEADLPSTPLVSYINTISWHKSYRAITVVAAQQKESETTQRAEREVSRMVVAMVLAFLICWLPYAIFAMLMAANKDIVIDPSLASMPSYFSKTATVYNPVIYVFMNKQSIVPRVLGIIKMFSNKTEMRLYVLIAQQ